MIIKVKEAMPLSQVYWPLVMEIKNGLATIAANTQAWILGEFKFDDPIYNIIQSALYEGNDSENVPFIAFFQDFPKNFQNKNKRIKTYFIESTNNTLNEISNKFEMYLRKNLPYSHYKSDKTANLDDTPFKVPSLDIIINGCLNTFDSVIEALKSNKPILVVKVRI